MSFKLGVITAASSVGLSLEGYNASRRDRICENRSIRCERNRALRRKRGRSRCEPRVYLRPLGRNAIEGKGLVTNRPSPVVEGHNGKLFLWSFESGNQQRAAIVNVDPLPSGADKLTP